MPLGVAIDVAVLTSEVVSGAVWRASTTEWEEIILRVNRDKRIRVEVIDGGNGVRSIRSRSLSRERLRIGSHSRRPARVRVGCRPEGRLHDRLVRSRLGDESLAAVILVPVGGLVCDVAAAPCRAQLASCGPPSR